MPGESDSAPELWKLIHSHSLNTPGSMKPDRNIILDEYYSLVERYCARELTYDSDKLPAFSGLAALVHPVISGEYLAGIVSVTGLFMFYPQYDVFCASSPPNAFFILYQDISSFSLLNQPQ
jgi:hypothetical protein